MADATTAAPGTDFGTALSSFLTEGAQIPSGSALKASQSQTILPEWYTNYAQDLLAAQTAAAGTPYRPYQGPRLAEFSPAQQQAFAQTGAAAGAYQPALSAATSATQNLMGQTALGAAQPYFTRATGMNAVGAATPGLEQAARFATSATTPAGMQAAQPYLTQAGRSSVADIGQYMNPYQEQVVNRIGELGARNLSENILPGIEGRYIAAGQLGFGGRQPRTGTPSGMMLDVARAIRGTQEATTAAQSEALQKGYSEAAGLSSADLTRQAQLAQTAGQLGASQQGVLSQAAQNLADIGKTYGTLTADQQKLLADIGTQTAGITGSDITRQLGAAQQLAGLGEAAQTLGLREVGALSQVGGTQQEQAQKALDIAREDYLREQGYPQAQIDAALKTFSGIAGAVPTATQEVGIVPTGQQAQYQPSTASTIGGTLTGLGAILSSFKKP